MKQSLNVFGRILLKILSAFENRFNLKQFAQLRAMTVSYSDDLATAKFQTLFKLLFRRWRGSVMKLLWRDLLLYFSLYIFVQIILNLTCPEKEAKVQNNVDYLQMYQLYVPLSFLLGFFVTNVMVRWWDQYRNIPWPNNVATFVSSTVHGYDEVGRAMRRTIMRYVCLSLTMVFRTLSIRVQTRFPKMSDMVTAGFLTNSELKIIEEFDEKCPKYEKNWLPILWAASIVNRARSDGRIRDDFAVRTLIKELNKFRFACGVLIDYNEICIPLVYLQVVTIAVYGYFGVGLFTHRCVYFPKSDTNFLMEFENLTITLYPLILLMLQFIVYMGLLKVAETMMNPYGNDDDDFEVNFLIDKNLRMSYMIVDEMHNEHPELLKDQYWDKMPKKFNDRFKQDNNDNGPIEVITAGVDGSENTNTAYHHLIPSASIIDPSYSNKPNVEATQILFKIEQARQKQLIDTMIKQERRRSSLIFNVNDFSEEASSLGSFQNIRRDAKSTIVSENKVNPEKPKDDSEDDEKK